MLGRRDEGRILFLGRQEEVYLRVLEAPLAAGLPEAVPQLGGMRVVLVVVLLRDLGVGPVVDEARRRALRVY